MNQLVIMQDREAVTSSLVVAENFDRRHDHLIRDIRNLEKDIPNFGEMFREEIGPDSYGRTRKFFYMNRDGFTLLAMGFTGSKAMEFKLKYLRAFNQMEEALKTSKVLSQKEQLMASMQLTLDTAQELEDVKGKVELLEDKVDNHMTLDYGMQRRLQRAVGERVYKLSDDPQERPKLFREIYREIKDRFGVASYKDVRRKELQAAINYVEAWIPKRAA